MKKYAPRKVFILENGEYIEITNVEHESRLDNDPAYANRFFIPVQGFLLEVDQEHYEDFYRTKDRLTYLNRLDIKYGLLSIDAFDTEDDNGTDYISDDTEDVADTVRLFYSVAENFTSFQVKPAHSTFVPTVAFGSPSAFA